jgi:hypothetical protein
MKSALFEWQQNNCKRALDLLEEGFFIYTINTFSFSYFFSKALGNFLNIPSCG